MTGCYDRDQKVLTRMRARIWSRVFPESVQGRRSLFPLSGRIAIALIWTLLPALATAQTATGLGDTPQAGKTDPVAGDTTVTLESRKAPQPANKGDSRPVDIRVNKTLVLINVTVTDPLNRFVTGLEKENFRVFEDSVEQAITKFSSEDAPIAIGLVFDTSGSMGDKLRVAAWRPRSSSNSPTSGRIFPGAIQRSRRDLEVPLTKDTGRIQGQLTFPLARGDTRCWMPSTWRCTK